MPLEIYIEPNPDFTPDAAKKAAWESVKRRGKVKTAFVTAKEAVANSGGMYRMAPKETEAAPVVKPRSLEDYDTNELKALYFGMGNKVPTGKQIRRADMIAAIRTQWEAVEILDDEA